MSEESDKAVVFDAQVNVACSLYRSMAEAQLWVRDSKPGARALYEQTRSDLYAQLIGRLEGLVPPEVVRIAATDYAESSFDK